jgi:hypothetical protein
MDLTDAALLALASLLLVPFVSRLQRLALRALLFSLRWSFSALVVVAAASALRVWESPRYAALKLAALGALPERPS